MLEERESRTKSLEIKDSEEVIDKERPWRKQIGDRS